MAYGAAQSSTSEAKVSRVRTQAVRLIWGRGRSKRAPELVFLTLTEPCRSEPQCALAVEAITSILWGTFNKKDRFAQILKIAAVKNSPNKDKGNDPTSKLLASLRVLGFSLSPTGLLHHPLIPTISLDGISVKELVPYLREAAEIKLCRDLATRS